MKRDVKKEGIIRSFDLGRPSVRIGYILMYLALALVVLACLMPFVWILFQGFKDQKEFIRGVRTVLPDLSVRYIPRFLPEAPAFERYASTWRFSKFGLYYMNSFFAVIGCALCAVSVNGLLAYGISRLKPRGYKVVLALVMGSLMLPAITSMAPLFVSINTIGLSGTFWPLWLGAGASAFYVMLFKSFYDALPNSLLESARLDGCNNLSLFTRMVLPLSMPINMVVIIYAVNGAWSDFLLPYLVLSGARYLSGPLKGLTRETVMVRLFTLQSSNRTTDIDIIRAVVFSIIPPIILFIIFQRRITLNVVSAGIKG
jgi:multiple sugar transport system permease protein